MIRARAARLHIPNPTLVIYRGLQSAGGAARKGPKRAQPLAPLCKFPGMAGAVAAWEGPPVVLDGTAGYRCSLPHALAMPWMFLRRQDTQLQPCCALPGLCHLQQGLHGSSPKSD